MSDTDKPRLEVAPPQKPSLGRIVIYRDPFNDEDLAAIITDAGIGNRELVVGLTVFNKRLQGPTAVMNVGYSVETKGCWRWPDRV